MSAQEIVIKNAVRNRKFGKGISTQPTGHGTEIAAPSGPDYIGTFGQIGEQMRNDRRYLQSIQSAFKHSRLFYDGKIIESVWRFGAIKDNSNYIFDETTGEAPWVEDKCAVYDYAWFDATSNINDLIDAIAKDGSLRIRVKADRK